jgi:hypothetical protein
LVRVWAMAIAVATRTGADGRAGNFGLGLVVVGRFESAVVVRHRRIRVVHIAAEHETQQQVTVSIQARLGRGQVGASERHTPKPCRWCMRCTCTGARARSGRCQRGRPGNSGGPMMQRNRRRTASQCSRLGWGGGGGGRAQRAVSESQTEGGVSEAYWWSCHSPPA